MLCRSCKKNQATNIYERITDGKKQTEYYCADCYHRLFHSTQNIEEKEVVCKACGCTAKEFLSSGLVGCEHCYTALKGFIEPSVKRMQGKEVHVGKTPAFSDVKTDVKDKIKALRSEVEACIKNRDYKRANECLAELKKLNLSLQEEGDAWKSLSGSSKRR